MGLDGAQPNIDRLRAGDEIEWSRVQREYTGRLLRYVGKRVEDHQAREDILQETFLGALRGIASFDTRYQFEQYLFGICRNRTIDFLRRRPVRGMGGDEEESVAMLERLAVDEGTPSVAFGLQDLGRRGGEILASGLQDFVEETFASKEWQRLKVVELLLGMGERNSHVARELGIQDESAVAGIKFRALKRLASLAGQGPEAGSVGEEIAAAIDSGKMNLDVAGTWQRVGATCAHSYWWARYSAGMLEEGLADYMRFHLERVKCDRCQATLDDLEQSGADLEPLVTRLQASTAIVLRQDRD